ncbi:DUF1993 domain-containing protein [Aurantiacibacter sp. MUD11]|uniref:DUF1993 domain-containing protein n=1 Tax=Aurantiacibacter sp. MUD11 TaxID=3003265 RepID=UPI0022AA9EA4|nr:DUF1993 domain-containing protein [Aurantiacibacter sp. MUD11]WAT18959.1 DUF1993 domain-containing protein [Aurantiacibacter sp. MUD11]
MSFSLYQATVPTMIQMLQSAQGWIEKAKASDLSEEEIAGACLREDMAPFPKQINWMLAYAHRGIEAVRKGVMNPDLEEPPQELEQMRLNIGAAENQLRALSPAEVESFIGKEMRFVYEPHGVDLPFTAENFLLGFAQPNFYFHATTAYAILRHKGVELGKLDYLGPIPMKQG